MRQMSALSVVSANLITNSMAPLTHNTGGTSKSDPSAGTDTSSSPTQTQKPIGTKDRAGAGILTALVIIGIIGGSIWIIL